MIIERVELENILVHRRTQVNLGKGIIAIVGPNGAGKTSLVDAITYTFFGTHSRDPRSRKDAIIRLGAPSARITIDFTHNGKLYRIQKLVSRQGRTETRLFEVSERLKPIATTTASTVAELKRILGIDPSIAERLIVTRQGQIEDILINKDKRLELINNILKLKAIERAHERLAEIIRSIKKIQKYKEEQLRREESQLNAVKKDLSMLDDLRRVLVEKRALLKKTEDQYNALKEKLEKTRDQMTLLQEKLGRLKTLEQEYRDTRQRLDSIISRITSLKGVREELAIYNEKLAIIEAKRKLLELLQQVEPLKSTVAMLEKQVNELRDEIVEKDRLKRCIEEYKRLEQIVETNKDIEGKYKYLINIINNIENQINNYKNRIEELMNKLRKKAGSFLPFEPPNTPDELLDAANSLLETLRHKREELEHEREKVLREIAVLESRLRDTKDKIEKLGTARGACPLCGRPLSDEERVNLIRRLRREREQVEARLHSLYEKRSLLEKQIEKLKKAISDTEVFVKDVKTLVVSIQHYEEFIRQSEKTLREKKAELLETYAEYKEYQEALEKLKNLQECVKRYDAIVYLEMRLSKLEEELAEKRRSLEEAMGRLKSLVEELGLKEVPGIESLSKEINEFMKKYSELREKSIELDLLERQKKELETRIQELREEIEELRSTEKEYLELTRIFALTKSELEKHEQQLLALREEVAKIEEHIRLLERRRREAEELEKRVAELRGLVERYEKALGALEKIRRILGPQGLPRVIREAAKMRLEQSLTEMLQEFNIDFDYLKLDEDYNVYLVTRRGEKSVQMLSGGERIALAIAYKLALARVIGERVEAMIMDEPTIHLDEERRRELVSIIKRGLEATGLSQLVIVTHERELEEAADKVVEVRRDGDESIVIERLPGDSQTIEA